MSFTVNHNTTQKTIMKLTKNKLDLLKASTLLKISGFILISVASFYFSKQWSPSAGYKRLLFFSFHPNPEDSVFSSVENDKKVPFSNSSLVVKKMGVLDENGVMRDDFEVGDFDPKAALESFEEGYDKDKGKEKNVEKNWVKKFEMCPDSMREYIPCLDNVEVIKKLNSGSINTGEIFERHCPEIGRGLNCLIPAPKGYKAPISWPNSRDEVWFTNVPHAKLVEDKGGQNWVTIKGDKFKFPGGGTQFIHGADQYLDQIEKMVPEIAFGKRTRVVLDVGCGVASFGAYLFSRDVLTFSIAPKDVHENQIQFALERGVPSMVAAFATRRLPYPSQAFDLIHCSRCRVNWTQNDGLLLLEVNRILRAGGYFAWAAQPVYKHGPLFEEQWEEMVNLTSRLCWKLVKKEGYIAIWQKPTSNNCYLSREEGTQPPLCELDDDPDRVWYEDLKPCITRLPEEAYSSNVFWPASLQSPPKRLQSLQIDAYVPRNEIFRAETNYWKRMVEGYVDVLKWKSYKLRNVIDMRAGFGGFAAALIDYELDCWVLNVIPVTGPNTLPVIYDRGLIGVMHDWCEPFDTYPRTYDLLNADGLFSIERKRCNISTIMLEMDRILRPGGHVYIRDSIAIVGELVATGKAIGWKVTVRDTGEGPHASYRLMVFDKHL